MKLSLIGGVFIACIIGLSACNSTLDGIETTGNEHLQGIENGVKHFVYETMKEVSPRMKGVIESDLPEEAEVEFIDRYLNTQEKNDIYLVKYTVNGMRESVAYVVDYDASKD